jgi:putative colanic acid biosynthesis acetyltransferase WcaB
MKSFGFSRTAACFKHTKIRFKSKEAYTLKINNMNVFQDWQENRENIKERIILVLFRVSHLATRNVFWFMLLLPHLIFYRVIIDWVMGVEIPYKTRIGKGLRLFHGQALVVNSGTIIGDHCTIRHSTTIGNKQLRNGLDSSCPVIGNYVDIGANVCIIGPVTIGNHVKIGAGSVVVKDVPDHCIVAGNPAKIIGMTKTPWEEILLTQD